MKRFCAVLFGQAQCWALEFESQGAIMATPLSENEKLVR
jgi:hypothetical protein